jgi:hypothetical protein
MSISLPTVNLSSVAVGQSGTVSFQNAGVDANPAYTKKPPTVEFQNESGTGLNIVFQLSGGSFTLAAGKHRQVQVLPGESGFIWTALYNLPNPPVTSLYTDYYYPNEAVPDTGMLGNSPIGIGGTISVTNVTALSNETTTVKTLIIDIGLVGNTLLYQLFSDGSASWSVMSGGTPHTVIQVNNTGNPLVLGKVGDNVEVLGGLFVDGALSVTGTSSVATVNGTNLNASSTVSSNQYNDGSGNSVMAITPGSVTRLQTNTGGTIAFQVNGASQASISTAAFNVTPAATFSSNVTANGGFTLGGATFNYGLYTNSLSRISTGTYASAVGAHTTNHNLGAVPSNVLTTGGVSTGTATTGSDTYGATTFTSTEGAAGVTMRFRAERF